MGKKTDSIFDWSQGTSIQVSQMIERMSLHGASILKLIECNDTRIRQLTCSDRSAGLLPLSNL